MPPKRQRRSLNSNEVREGFSSRPNAQRAQEGLDVITNPDPAVSADSNRGPSTVVIRNRRRPARSAYPRRSLGGRKVKGSAESDIPDVYREMLQEVAQGESSKNAAENSEESARKRRKIARSDAVVPKSPVLDRKKEDVKGKGKSVAVETSSDSEEEVAENEDEVINDIESEDDSDESDIDWEDVDLSKHLIINPAEPSKSEPLELVLDNKEKRKTGPARRKITAVERRIRLEVHKMHLICLLYHVYLRSKWCNSSVVKENLKPLIPKEVYNQLNWDPKDQQFRRSHRFLEGLKNAVTIWKKNFKVTRRGISRPYWKEPEALQNFIPPANIDPPMKKDDFFAASHGLEGSRDLGAQLFCALLRSAGVTCRLVCSLQPLSFSFTGDEKARPIKPKPTIPAVSPEDSNNSSDSGVPMPRDNRYYPTPSMAPVRTEGGGVRTLLQAPLMIPSPVKKPTKKIVESPYPVYWVEAWNVAMQKWVAVDPLVTGEVGKPSKIEPPISDRDNMLSYVVGFEEEGQVKDVTRRYAKSYNGRTRRLRVESTKGGGEWWRRVLSNFQRGYELDRDQVEEAELAQKEVSEGIPNNIQALKGHPLFALKRHLCSGEIIHPERRVSTITVGTGKNKVTETIFRREDVKVVKSSVQWYRQGREIKSGEQPIKYITSRRLTRKRRRMESEDEDEDDEEKDGQTGMYAEFQTVLYEPPEIVDGCVPKNGFGNLDVFVPSMVPKGGVHLPYKEAAKAAKLLGIDYAEAVTGFEFKNRQASATINGVVVAEEYGEAVKAIVQGLIEEKDEAEALKKSMESLKRWRRFLLSLRIRERLEIYDEPDKSEGEERVRERKVVDTRGDEDMGGGFLPEDVNEQDGEGGAFIDEDMAGGFLVEESVSGSQDGTMEEIGKGEGFFNGKDTSGGVFRESIHHRGEEKTMHHHGTKAPETTTEEIAEGGGFVIEEDAGGGSLPEAKDAYGNEIEEDDGMLSEDPDDKDFEWY